jgi:hypothetical protein
VPIPRACSRSTRDGGRRTYSNSQLNRNSPESTLHVSVPSPPSLKSSVSLSTVSRSSSPLELVYATLQDGAVELELEHELADPPRRGLVGAGFYVALVPTRVATPPPERPTGLAGAQNPA